MDNSHQTEQQSVAASKKRLYFLVIVSFVIVIGLIGCLWCWSLYQSMYRNLDITVLSKEPPRAAFFYDRNGGVITELTNARMQYTTLDQFPQTLLDAVIAVEDARFYEHNGIDFYAIARAFYTNLKSGETVQGGSTITQQLAKTMLFSEEQTYSRKLNEAVASIKIEHSYTKDQILELYLNHIYFGEGAWGLQRAAQVYFGKKASELTLAESALMAGLPKSPINYSPVKKPEQSKARRNLVLNLMAEQGKITAEARDAAKQEEIRIVGQTALKTTDSYPSSYIDHVINEAIDKFGMTEEQILSQGLHIHTNMDPKVQAAAEEVYKNASFFPEDKGGLQSGIVLMDPKTGALWGIVGSRNAVKDFRGFNYATQNKRQPGSTIKPVLVYAPALLAGFGPRDHIHDVETDFGGGYKPMNYMKKLNGWVTLEKSLVESYNIPAVALLKEVGMDKAIEFGKQAGLPLEDADRTLGIALGGMQQGTSPLVMAQAYTMFANGGNMAQAYAITKIVDQQGKLVAEAVPDVQPMMDASQAYTMTKMLEKVVTEGTERGARMHRPVAGKTGTTELPDIPEFQDKRGKPLDGSKDAWFVGYTPEIVAAIWLGYEKTNKDHYLTTTGGKYPATLFKEVVTRALAGRPVTTFAKPKAYRPVYGGNKFVNSDRKSWLAYVNRNKKPPEESEQKAVPGASATEGVAEAGAKPGTAPGSDASKPADPNDSGDARTAGTSANEQTSPDSKNDGSRAAPTDNKPDGTDSKAVEGRPSKGSAPASAATPQGKRAADAGGSADDVKPTESNASTPAGNTTIKGDKRVDAEVKSSGTGTAQPTSTSAPKTAAPGANGSDERGTKQQ
ncbi:transglycosylase domain-containing protein [Paenibacillus xerothermodurans]|uniref:PBP1A family penicillin-binding protein n=1 Tax=Paenibacillus xerothermodurans TaxID=1977292 RepID=A0A2W1NZQ9_PAEXE|nr:PBP1A family penicillin-binding protein [Paenibacillus xerothermodurans]PZE20368.1 PBP1A family penicillin-binding protein [Paenibacillus xerothermodurans]